MTAIKYSLTTDTFVIGINGHAGYSIDGKDIVCASISTITCMMINELDRLNFNNNISRLHKHIDNGKVAIECKINSKGITETLSIINTLIRGYESVSENYNKYVTIEHL